MSFFNGHHADPILMANEAKMKEQRLQQITQQALEAIHMLVPNGCKVGLVIKAPPHVGDAGHFFMGNMTIPEVVDTGRGLARRNGINLQDVIDKDVGDKLHDLIEQQKRIMEAAERLAGKVRRALMFLPDNPAAAISALRQALGVEQEPDGDDAA